MSDTPTFDALYGDFMQDAPKITAKHVQVSERRISPGSWWEGPNQEAVRVVSHKAPDVRYAHHSYDGAICRTTATHFLSRFKPISEERATEILRHPARTTPKVIKLP